MEEIFESLQSRLTELGLVFDKADDNKIIGLMLDELKINALSEARGHCSYLKKGDKPVSVEEFDNFSADEKAEVICLLGSMGIKEFTSQSAKGKINISFSAHIQKVLSCAMFIILNKLENLDGAIDVVSPEVEVTVQAPLGGKKGLSKCYMLMQVLYPWCKKINETSSNEVASMAEKASNETTTVANDDSNKIATAVEEASKEMSLRVFLAVMPANQRETDEIYLFKTSGHIDFEVVYVSGLKEQKTRRELPTELIEKDKVYISKLLNYIKEQAIPMHNYSVPYFMQNDYVDIEKFEIVKENKANTVTSQSSNIADNLKFKGDLARKTEPKTPYKMGYDVDLVFCIDNSENMVEHLDGVKKWIPEIIERYTNCCPLNVYGIRNYRARLITFNDYRVNRDTAIQLTDFFDLKNEKERFLRALNCVKIQPGYAESVCGFEALTYAARSKWSEEYRKRRYIWVFSNSDANSIEAPEIIPLRQKGLPKSLEEFEAHWRPLNDNYAIWLMTPDTKHWKIICENFNCLCFPSAAGEGLREDKISFNECFGDVYLGFD